jgi:hypothetical protein
MQRALEWPKNTKNAFSKSAILNFCFKKKVYWLERMGKKFDQAKRDDTF